ncbi:MAG TPA: cupin domain-containing protein [bacterium]|nr:cupin domain-containing protein [Candidatus Omnitrophota bacterium]HOJ61094.1 cupin domain-containing protein [bacterium]HOL94117.1 cupin domain-containing protein [bacterium]HPP01516.1 cupin domain-containing protein [bacterium]HXK95925.1 cupin domain-containing protein [bacterium]
MPDSENKPPYLVKRAAGIPPVECPCGSSIRIITRDDTPVAGFHITHIQDSQRHYHRRTTEIYHILEGHGFLEVAGDIIPLEPGLTLLINPGVPHRGYGDFKTIVVPVPAFDPADEFLVDEARSLA